MSGPVCKRLLHCKHIIQSARPAVKAVCCLNGTDDLDAAPRALHAHPQDLQTELIAPRAVASATACCTEACMQHWPDASSQGRVLQ